jgi:hypothetical protein
MANRRMYKGNSTALSARGTLKIVVGAVMAGAVIGIFALIIAKGGSGDSDPPEAAKFVGLRHDAVSMPPAAETLPRVPTSDADQGQKPSSDTVVRNGVTVVSPRLLVPVIDIDSIQSAQEWKDFARTQSRYVNRSHKRHQRRIAAKRRTAYGIALR